MLNKPKGTYDVLPEESLKWQKLEEFLKRLLALYNYQEIRTPIFEDGAVFHRNNDDTSDMVTKETYDFVDRGGRLMTLRPEGTAGVVRSYIENKLYGDNNLKKLYYLGPQFRYERSQKGRYRQFMQFGVEAIGANSPLLDAEVISLAYNIISKLKIPNTIVKINTLGDKASRESYKEALIKYFSDYEDLLCPDCLKRLEKNPLRLLDCKVCSKVEFFQKAPAISAYLNDESKERFQKVQKALECFNTRYVVDEFLVRGLDYYAHTVFEIIADESLGAQNALAAGGHYDKLVSDLGGPDLEGMGFALGMERLLIALDYYKLLQLTGNFLHLYLIALDKEAELKALELINNLRLGGLRCEMDYQNKSFKANLNYADKLNSKFIGIIGENEVKNSEITLKNKTENSQITIKLSNLYSFLKDYFNKGQCNNCEKGKN